MSFDYQVIVVGSGSGGKEACLGAARAGLRTLLVEEKALGGTSFHRGSYAVRALRACASYLKNTEKKSNTQWTDWRTAYHRTSNRLIVELSQAIDQEKVELRLGRAKLVGPHEISVLASPGLPQRLSASQIILATGSRPDFPSEPEAGILNSDDLLQLTTCPQHLFVIGGGYIGCELASIFRDLGALVTIAEAQSRLLPNWDPIAGISFQSLAQAAAIEVLLNERVEVPEFSAGEKPAYLLNRGKVIQPDVTLVATGRSPNSEELGLEAVGLPSRGWIQVNEHMQTRQSSIYAVGDVTGLGLLDSVAAAQARVAVQSILGIPARFDKHCFPHFLHTEPPIASIGWTEDEAKASSLPAEALVWKGALFTEDDFNIHKREPMAIKCLIHSESKGILGCIAVGSRAAEVINFVSAAITAGQSAQELSNLSVVHPSATEAFIKVLQQYAMSAQSVSSRSDRIYLR